MSERPPRLGSEWIRAFFQDPAMLAMGHVQRMQDENLGLGWLYYALARIIRPKRVVIIGSQRGFTPLIIGKGLHDNEEQGEVLFIDPSMVDNFWKDEPSVNKYFAERGVTNIRHFLMTTQEFVHSETYHSLNDIGIVFVDGYHSYEQVRCDLDAFVSRLSPDGVFLFHDSGRDRISHIYGPEKQYMRGVKRLMDELRVDSAFEVFSLPFGEGVTLVRPHPQPVRRTSWLSRTAQYFRRAT